MHTVCPVCKLNSKTGISLLFIIYFITYSIVNYKVDCFADRRVERLDAEVGGGGLQEGREGIQARQCSTIPLKVIHTK